MVGAFEDVAADMRITTRVNQALEEARLIDSDFPGASISEIGEIDGFIEELIRDFGMTPSAAKGIVMGAYQLNGMVGVRQAIGDLRSAEHVIPGELPGGRPTIPPPPDPPWPPGD